MIMDLDDVIKLLDKENPDKMLLDDFDAFTRGKLAGKIELILRLIKINEDGVKDG